MDRLGFDRLWETADIVGGYLGITPILKDALRERNLGKAVGKSVQWLRENIECQEKTVDDRMFSDAECQRDVWNRLHTFFEEMMQEEQENIILVSHGGLLSLFNLMWLGMDVEALNFCDLFGFSGGVSLMSEKHDGKRCIRKLSDMSYIQECI